MTNNNDLIPLSDWLKDNKVDRQMIFWKNYMIQIEFVSDVIPRILTDTSIEYKKLSEEIKVINYHVSKSIILPVYFFEWNGIKFIMRGNFSDWKISVISDKDINIDFKDLFDKNYQVNPMYCEGFGTVYVLKPYGVDNRNFTFSVHGDYDLYVFFWLIKNYL